MQAIPDGRINANYSFNTCMGEGKIFLKSRDNIHQA